MSDLASLLAEALERRALLLARLDAERTTALRLFHGVAEGRPGLTVDRYGPLVLVQTFREPLSAGEIDHVESVVRAQLPGVEQVGWIHRANRGAERRWSSGEVKEAICTEFGVRFPMALSHRGNDPWLYLDLRAGRRRLRGEVTGRSVLNLFSYTGAVGISLAAAGASEVWNVDFARSSLDVGERSAALNGLSSSQVRSIHEDCLPVMRQLAGLKVGLRRGKERPYLKLSPRSFDVVVLDPPAWAKGPFGAVDVVRDYAALFKPALLSVSAGGLVLATNHVAQVPFDDWADALKRCAIKAGRPIQSLERVLPEEDFPSVDANPPLKIALCRL